MNRKKKILFVITQGGPWGGAQRYVFDLATGLTEQFEVTIAIGEKQGAQNLQQKLAEANSPISIVQLHHLVRRISPAHDVNAVFECAALYKKLQPDIIHANSSKAGVIAALAKQFARISTPLVYTVHGWVMKEPIGRLKQWLYRTLERRTARYKDAYIVLSPTDRDVALTELPVQVSQVTRIPLGIEKKTRISREEARTRILEHCHLPADTANTVWVGSIANFFPTKGIDILIDAIAIAKQHTPDLQVFLMGDGPERQALEQQITRLNLGTTIHLTGFVEDASQYLPAFDFIVIPSRKEGIPYVLLEAAQQNIPVIATTVGGIPYFFQQGNVGVLVPPQHPQELAQAIIQAHQQPEQMRRSTPQQPTSTLHTNASLEGMRNDTIALYSQLLMSKRQ